MAGSAIAIEDRFRTYANSIEFPPATHSVGQLDGVEDGQEVVVHGYIASRVDLSKTLSFAGLVGPDGEDRVQLVSRCKSSATAHDTLRSLSTHSPVCVKGVARNKRQSAGGQLAEQSGGSTQINTITNIEIAVSDIQPLNRFPADILAVDGTRFGPDQRHLHLRLDRSLRRALAVRAQVGDICRDELATHSFIEIETPILFKSTPEGAREFIVPTRTKGLAYALPQSPQQYKQMLMASGIARYFQIARCFRDEDHRADRQPEFTQLDLELAFATGQDVMAVIERLVRRLWAQVLDITDLPAVFPRLDYQSAMSRFGSDKPDLRFGMEISSVTDIVPAELVSKISSLENPTVEMFVFRPSPTHGQTEPGAQFISRFMDSPESKPFTTNPDGQPAFCFYDPSRPLSGLDSLGFSAASTIESSANLKHGDVIVLQARPHSSRHSGGSTSLGRLRLALHSFAVAEKQAPPPTGFKFTWIVDFPLFSPDTSDGSGQGGSAGLASTHHPFTAPKSLFDLSLLNSDPTAATADHYDLVVNGVELGGGSRRIHDPDFQQFVLESVLRLDSTRLQSFSHLLDALRAGCPPHAGFAVGLDRLVAVMLDRQSVRDVIAFPKTGSGEDLMVGSPSTISQSQMDTYHLRFRD